MAAVFQPTVFQNQDAGTVREKVFQIEPQAVLETPGAVQLQQASIIGRQYV